MTAPGQPRGTAGAMRQRGVSLIELMVALVIGLIAYAVLNGRLPKKASTPAMAPTPINKGGN